MLQFIEDFQIVSDRAGDAISHPDYNDVKLAAAGIVEELIESRPPGFRAAHFIRVFANDFEAALLCQLA